MIEDKLKELIINKHGSVLKFTQKFGIPYSTMTSLFSRGVNKTNINTILKVCQALNISADELANGRITFLQEVERPLIEFEKLTEINQEKLKAYYQALLDSQENKE
jgi:DNA-binding Xre family transcriptional regulator